MCENISWIFDGIGTSILTGITGLVIGSIGGYKYGIHKTSIKQNQKAGDNANQSQIGIANGHK